METLECDIRDYPWGDRHFIAELLGTQATGEPQAELWMGSHPAAPSRLRDGRRLGDVIREAPGDVLGSVVADRFGELPFLAKILAAAEPLSIQVHPTAAHAAAGYERENNAGLPLEAAARVYRDAHHKPEILCALTHFEAKRGFRELDATRELFGHIPDRRFDAVRALLSGSGPDERILAETVRWLLTEAAAGELASIAPAATAGLEAGPYGREFDWTQRIAEVFPGDPGVLVALLLNHVSLEPGEAIYLGPGTVHAYLAGAGVEVMANSDNVIRGGLTSKHVDVGELMAVADFRTETPFVQQAGSSHHTYVTPVPEFSLTRVCLDGTTRLEGHGPKIVLCTSGRARISAGDSVVELDAGRPVFVSDADGPTELSGEGLVFVTAAGRCLG